MEHKLPYYLSHPMTGMWDEGKRCKRDREYMKSIYPEMGKMLLPYVDRECDRLEYEGSLIYDEYPDKLLLRLMCKRVFRAAINELEDKGFCATKVEKDWLQDMIEILVYQELCKRREEWREQKRRWF